MSVAYTKDIPPPDHLTGILGCEFNQAGECVRHQPRPFDPRREGCPLKDAITRGVRQRHTPPRLGM